MTRLEDSQSTSGITEVMQRVSASDETSLYLVVYKCSILILPKGGSSWSPSSPIKKLRGLEKHWSSSLNSFLQQLLFCFHLQVWSEKGPDFDEK